MFSHTVGMAVHDVGSYANAPLKSGQVFSVDPQLRVREEKLYLRYEDTVVVTETGFENFTDFLPMELDEIERLVLEKGVMQKVPPIDDRLDPGVTELAVGWMTSAACVATQLFGPELSSVPAPWKPEVPGSTVGPERRAKRPELEPAYMQLARVLGSQE